MLKCISVMVLWFIIYNSSFIISYRHKGHKLLSLTSDVWYLISISSHVVFSIYLLTLRIIPKAMLEKMIEVPPMLTIGSVNPVTGTM